MNENIDLTKILKDCPEGTEFYHAGYGRVWFCCLDLNFSNYPIRLSLSNEICDNLGVTSKGTINKDCNGECLLFPSKEQRNWSKFTAPWYKKEKLVELKESKDKKIREAILNGLIDCRDAPDLGWSNFGGIHIDDCIAWLENKGEQNLSSANEHTWLYLVSDVLTWKYGIGQYLDNPGVQELAKRLCDKYAQKLYSPSVLSNSPNTGKDEQKSDDKVEPKFKVGDWVVRGDIIAQILDIQEQYYVGLDINGKDFVSSRFLNDNKVHLWTINDAKDGDILAISWWEDENFWEKIIIFKKYHNKGVKELYSMPCIEGYGNTFKNGKIASTGEGVPYYSKTWTCDLLPATKKQHDVLIKTINDAGYEWNAEKKELKKLVHNRFDPKTLQPFDKILVKGNKIDCVWKCSLHSHFDTNYRYSFCANTGIYKK